MTSDWLRYLAAATACQAVLALFYALVLARLRAFRLNRAYLLGALLLGAALPLLPLPAAWVPGWLATSPAAGDALPWALGPLGAPGATGPVAESSDAAQFWLNLLPGLLLGSYWLGVAWQVGRTVHGLGWLLGLRRHPRSQLPGGGWLVQLPAPGQPAFSLGRYVFLSPAHQQLEATEYAQLLAHEQVHGQQRHFLDLLLAEVVGWFFWFNGVAGYLGRQLRAVHEYLADAATVPAAGGRVAYGHLLLKLAAGPLPASLAHPFAARQVARRIHMLILPPSSRMQQLRFLLVIPVVALAWVGAATLGPGPVAAAATAGQPRPAQAQGRIASISWQGNTFLSAAQLNEALGLKAGDSYDKATIETQLHHRPDGQDVEALYMDHGYLFFQVTSVAKVRPDGATDLTFMLNEGRPFRLNALSVQGNHRVATADILRMIPLHQGELFNRSKLVAAQRALAESGQFVPTQIGVNPQPLPDAGLVNVEFVVVEK